MRSQIIVPRTGNLIVLFKSIGEKVNANESENERVKLFHKNRMELSALKQLFRQTCIAWVMLTAKKRHHKCNKTKGGNSFMNKRIELSDYRPLFRRIWNAQVTSTVINRQRKNNRNKEVIRNHCFEDFQYRSHLNAENVHVITVEIKKRNCCINLDGVTSIGGLFPLVLNHFQQRVLVHSLLI